LEYFKMTCKERVTAAIEKQTPDRTPVYMGRIDDLDYWLESYGLSSEEEMRSYLGLDIRKSPYSGIYTVEEGKTIWGASDDWDAGFSTERGGYPLESAATVADVENHRWPTIDLVDFRELKKRIDGMKSEPAKILSLGWQPIFCTLHDLFGMENTLVHMYENPSMIEAAIEHMQHFIIEGLKQVLSLCGDDVDFMWLGDDFSSQRGLMLSPEFWRRFLKPAYKKQFECVKESGQKVWFHSCGTFPQVLPDLIDMGMDVWETVQVHLEGNDPEMLKREYGKHLTFFGAINCQKTLPFGTPEDVRKEVRDRIKVLGKGGGYICGPDHSIQKNMPAENIVALFDEARKCSI
jgi:uroporphyrinogen decarboxylase